MQVTIFQIDRFFSTAHTPDSVITRRGHWLQVSTKGLQNHTYWSALNTPDIRYKTDNEYVEHFQTLFTDVVQEQLRSKTSIASTLSGGLDSSSVSVTAAQLLDAKNEVLQTYTQVPAKGFSRQPSKGAYFDETERVQAISDSYSNLHNNLVRTVNEDIAQKFNELTSRYKMPLAGPVNAIWSDEIFQRVQARGINTILVGEGGNVTFSSDGYQLFPELLSRIAIPKLLHELLAFPKTSRQSLIRKWIISPFLPARFYQYWKRRKSALDNYWEYFGALNPQLAEESKLNHRLDNDSYDIYHQPMRNGKKWRAEALRSFVDTACYWQEIRAIHGIDMRSPPLDRRIIEFTQGIPEAQYLRGGINRWLIRRAMAGQLPEEVLNSNLCGVQSADWMEVCVNAKSELEKSINKIKDDQVLSNILDHSRLQKMVADIPDVNSDKSSNNTIALKFLLPVALSAARFVNDTNERNR